MSELNPKGLNDETLDRWAREYDKAVQSGKPYMISGAVVRHGDGTKSDVILNQQGDEVGVILEEGMTSDLE